MTCVWPTADCKSAVTGVRPGPEPVTEGDGSAACQNMRLTQIESVLVNHQVQAVCATRISVIPVRSLGLPGLAAGWPTARRQRSPGGPDTLFVAALDGEPLAFANGHADTITLLAPERARDSTGGAAWPVMTGSDSLSAPCQSWSPSGEALRSCGLFIASSGGSPAGRPRPRTRM